MMYILHFSVCVSSVIEVVVKEIFGYMWLARSTYLYIASAGHKTKVYNKSLSCESSFVSLKKRLSGIEWG
jgi:hypothetical protein